MSKNFLVAFFCWIVISDSSFAVGADPPLGDELSFSGLPHGSVRYQVDVQINDGTDEEKYEGYLEYHFEGRGQWRCSGSLREQKARPRDAIIVRLPHQLQHRNGIFPASFSGSCSFHVNPRGKVTSVSSGHPLPLSLGDFLLWGIQPLPKDDETKWEVVKPIVVQQVNQKGHIQGLPPRFAFPSSDPPKVSAALEKSLYRIVQTNGPITTIDHTYELDGSEANPSIMTLGKGTSYFDRKKGVFEEMSWTRDVTIPKGGAPAIVLVNVSIKRERDTGLLPLTKARKAELAETETAAKTYAKSTRVQDEVTKQKSRIVKLKKIKKMKEAEAAASSIEEKQKIWITVLDEATEYIDASWLLAKLRTLEKRENPELANSLCGLGNRLAGPSLNTQFFDTAARFDSRFASVLDLRKAYAHSHKELQETGDLISMDSKLQPGQLVAVCQTNDDEYRAKLVSKHEGEVLVVRALNSLQTESVDIAKVRFPAPRVIPYLPEQQRPTEQQIAASKTAQPPEAAPPLPLQTWTDKTGRYRVEARFVLLKEGVVQLEQADGTALFIRLKKLGKESAAMALQMGADPFLLSD